MTKKKDPKDYKKMGRPSKYNSLYCQQIMDFFDIDPILFRDVTITYKDGSTKEITEEEASPLPTFRKFAKSIGVYSDTLLEWCKNHPDFSLAYNRCKEAQQEFVIENTLRDNYQGYFAMGLMKNWHGWEDKAKVDHTGKVLTATVDLTDKSPRELIEFFRDSVSKGTTG